MKVTAIMKTMGMYSIRDLRLVFLRYTAQATSASTDSSWLALPNSGQISA